MLVSLSPPFGPSPRVSGLLRPRLTSRSSAHRAGSPFQTQGEISPGKNAILHRTAAGFTPPGPWPSKLRGLLPARPARHRLVSGFCPSARGLRSRLPSHARSPSRSCRLLRSRWPDYGRTSTSRTAPMLGAIGIGAASFLAVPSHTTRHAGPHRAVRRIEVTRVAALLSTRLYGPPPTLPRSVLSSGLHPYSPTVAPVAWTSEAICLRDP